MIIKIRRFKGNIGGVGAIVIMWLFVGETRGLDLKTVTGTEWDKPKKVKEEQQDGE